MNIIVCYKLIPDSEDMVVKPDGSISLEQAEWTISDYDLLAVEAGLQLVEKNGGKLIALSIGTEKLLNSKAKKDILSRGPDELYLVTDPSLSNADTNLTARVLAAAIQKIGGIDLVLFGEGSGDLYFQQVGLQVGEMLGQPTFNAISKIDVVEGGILVERSLESEIDVLSLPLPSALSVTTDINIPRLPTMKEILKAGKKPVTEWSLDDVALTGNGKQRVDVLSIRAPKAADRKRIMIDGSPEDEVQSLIGYLSKEGVL
jgi:electron transfer flavoprotein beta subunit